MEIEQTSVNQNLMETQTPSQQSSPDNNKLSAVVAISVLLTSMLTGSAVYFWQRSTSEKVIVGLEQKVSSLERQVSTIKEAGETSQDIDSRPPAVLSPEPQQNNQKSSQPPTPSLVKGASLSEIKYTLPDGWEAKMRLDQNDLFLSPKEEGGFLAIKVYTYDGKAGRREYYCQVSGFCIDGVSYFTQTQLGNISGYKAGALDNSGGGPEYFGAKGEKFYIISSFSPSYPPNNFFDRTYQQVLDSLVF